MDKEQVSLHLRTLFRHKDGRHNEVAAAFFSSSQSHDLYPPSVTTRWGTWGLSESDSEHVYGERYPYKCWAIYKIVIEEKEEEKEDD